MNTMTKMKLPSESDAGSMSDYGKSIGAHPMSQKQLKQIPSVKKVKQPAKFNKKKVARAATKAFKPY
jgi:hypothetical protein